MALASPEQQAEPALLEAALTFAVHPAVAQGHTAQSQAGWLQSVSEK